MTPIEPNPEKSEFVVIPVKCPACGYFTFDKEVSGKYPTKCHHCGAPIPQPKKD